jgi:hypothetical protein
MKTPEMSDLLQEWRAADRAATAAEKAVLADSLRSPDAMGTSPAICHLEKAKRRRAIANDLFEVAMEQMAARAGALKR